MPGKLVVRHHLNLVNLRAMGKFFEHVIDHRLACDGQQRFGLMSVSG